MFHQPPARPTIKRLARPTALTLLAAFATSPVWAYDIGDRWRRTITDGSGIVRGQSITLLWSIVPDGESYSRAASTDLIEYLDDGWNVPVAERTPDLTNRNWFAIMTSAYDQYNDVSGLNMVYVPEQNPDGSDSGQFGDIRIGGAFIDGPGGTLASNTFPDGGDMLIDTGRNGSGNPVNHTSASSLRNLISHESGHGVGLNHSDGIVGAQAVMERFLQTGFYGLQFDDVYAFNRLYGDPLEKNGGNDNFGTAFNLGTLSVGSAVARGTDANDAVVVQGDDDWLGIDGTNDRDTFRFTLDNPSVVNLTLTPQGPTYTTDEQGPNTNFAAQGDLNFRLYDASQSLINTADNTGAGQAETFSNLELEAGDYFIQIDGDTDINQFYRLDLGVTNEIVPYELIYQRATGKLAIDTRGGTIIEYTLNGAGFVEQFYTPALGGPATATDTTLSETDGGAGNVSGVFDLGQVLETGMDQSALEALLASATYLRPGGQPAIDFDLVIDERYALFYSAATGELIIDTLGNPLINYVIEGTGFLEENHTRILNGLGASQDETLSESSLAAVSGVLSLGNVLPAQLTPAQLAAALADLKYVAALGQPIETFEVGFLHIPGDTDLDVDVDDADLGTVFSNYTGPGGTGADFFVGDTDGDGDVDDADLGTVFSNYTGPRSAPPVPEPTSALALIALSGLLVRRRR